MSNRCITLILPVHNPQTARVLLAILVSEGKSDDVEQMGGSADITARNIINGFVNRRAAEGYSDVLQTDNLHLTISPDIVRYKGGKYRPQTIRVQISAYSCDPYGREAIGRIVEQAATRY